MKKLLLPLSCLLALSACWRHTREPDWNPAQDIPAGTLVNVTLRDVKDSSRVSTYVVDPRAGRVIARRDGKRAQQDVSSEVTAAQDTVAPMPVNTLVELPCRQPKTGEEGESGCVASAIDPKAETSDDPSPTKGGDESLLRTERFVVRVANGLLESAHTAGVSLGLKRFQQVPPTTHQ
ncbi:hypothetical protein HPC49_47465 [Pyxidicoccus fallax]|uniref:Lipoprotein n=1 Tax=Pyxidicoccus fallax TaxID=394095 RepID=A0A848LD31_9BACT|nr:hypothetical protein [Pyxidicoccus fallax]NMO14171.1 hypothetical protein [Pyxidicoccus fallax]NPC85817.1 hypothetical protein [Pyxidicoccus fallax]